ncbi:DNA-3-methyladenine glycosylase I [Niveibacterium terrae]|uniref:DNA-3-methyladenine glycosylase I n=1 Tax=Niveibacterium terrae TaxID=3373598 RepID=UPI003A916A76
MTNSDSRCRCRWVGDDPLYQAYHDLEWGVPVHEARALFENLCLEASQAGLAWITILRKREAYREAFAGFDAERIARFTSDDVARLLANPGIVRHRGKIEATIGNARAWLALQQKGSDASGWLWSFASPQDEPDAAERMSRALRRQGFRFLGPTSCLAFMQAVGMRNDHDPTCFRFREIAECTLASDISQTPI